MPAASDFVLFLNRGLSDADHGTQTGTVCEPGIANNGREILVTGNWYATRSLDNGKSWEYLSPYNAFPPVDDGFCCDQIVHYDPSRDLTLWLLQYKQVSNSNTLRLAVKQGATLGNNVWHWWDFRPHQVNSQWSDEWFDYPDLALSNDYLYLTTNAFKGNDWTRSVIIRMPLDDLAAGGELSHSFWSTTENFSVKCVQGARDVMYFASHNKRSDQIRVWEWPEATDAVSFDDVNVSAWNDDDYEAVGPDGKNWLSRLDGRITAGWVANGTLGFMWSANQGTSRPQPFVRVVRLREDTRALIDEPDSSSANSAYAHPTACPNARCHARISLC